jgi:hypothetical protein
MKAKTFDRKFGTGEKVVDELDLSKARRVGTDQKRVNVDFPGLDGGFPGSGSALAGRDATVADQTVGRSQVGPPSFRRKR